MIGLTLRSPRLLLRPLGPDDAPTIAALMEWDVVRWLSLPPWPYHLADAEWFVAAAAPDGEIARSGERTWALAEPGEPTRLLGVIGLGEELGYWIGRSHWGRGLMGEAARMVLQAHFARPEAGDVASGYFEGIERSAAIQRRLGFVPDGSRRTFLRSRGEALPEHRTRLTRAGWEALSR